MCSQFAADIAAGTMSEHESEGIDNSHQGENDAGSTADAGSKLTDKEGISHIVYTGHKHTDCGWQSKLQHQFVDRGFCHFVELFLCAVCLHNMYTFKNVIPGSKGRKSDASLLAGGFLNLGPAKNMSKKPFFEEK